MSAKPTLLAATALAAVVATAFFAWPRQQPEPPQPTKAETPAPTAAPTPATAPAALPPPPPPPAAAPGAIVYPDGSRQPALNGVGQTVRPTYPHWLQFTPVVGVVRGPDNRDWYVHADGTRTTCYLTWRADLGRYDAVADLTVPAAAKPVVDDESPRK